MAIAITTARHLQQRQNSENLTAATTPTTTAEHLQQRQQIKTDSYNCTTSPTTTTSANTLQLQQQQHDACDDNDSNRTLTATTARHVQKNKQKQNPTAATHIDGNNKRRSKQNSMVCTHLLGFVRDGREGFFPVHRRRRSEELDVVLDLGLDGSLLLREGALVPVFEESLLPLRLDLLHLVTSR